MAYLYEQKYPTTDTIAGAIPDEAFARLSDSEKTAELAAPAGKTYLQDVWSRFRKNKLAVLSLVFLAAMVLLAVFVPIFSSYTYDGMDQTQVNALPGADHLLGTDKFGRDILVRIMYGARISLSIGVAVAFVSLVIGVLYGVVCGYFGGKIDMILMRLVDIINSVPLLLYVILAVLILGANAYSVLIALSLSSWMDMARLVRGQILSLKEQDFAQAAYVLGAGKGRIMFRHLLVNCLGPIIVNATLTVPTAISTEAFLAFVGIGITAPQASWGAMANEARSLVWSQPLQMLWPILAIVLTMLSLNFIGEGLRKALEPSGNR